MLHPMIAALSDSPVLLNPERRESIAACLASLQAHEDAAQLLAHPTGLSADDDFWPQPDEWMARYRPYNVRDGVLQIPIMGVLLNRFGFQLGGFATGYQYIEKAFQRGLEDDNVKAIAFVIDSPGGEAAGNFELVDKLFAGRGEKPIRSFVADHAYSGGFSIATAADEVVVTRSGGTGSVGVVTMHVEMSKMLEDRGVKVTMIYAGKHKVDGNSFEQLSEDARKRIQARVDKIHDVFVSTVARNRGMKDSDVRETEALTYDAEDSVEVGFADRIGALEEELAVFALEVAAGEEDDMDPKTKDQKGAGDQISTADHNAAVATARSEAVTAERARVAGITGHDEAKGREAIALKLATTTDLTVEQAAGILAAMPKAAAEAPKGEQAAAPGTGTNHFAEAMAKSGNPDVGTGTGAPADDKTGLNEDDAAAAAILGSYRTMTGAPAKTN